MKMDLSYRLRDVLVVFFVLLLQRSIETDYD